MREGVYTYLSVALVCSLRILTERFWTGRNRGDLKNVGNLENN